MAGTQPQLYPPPQHLAAASAATEPPATSDPRPGVLVVDDDPLLRSLLSVTLQGNGFAVWLASGGAEAVQLYQRHQARINVVLLDVRMPALDGPHTLTELQRLNPMVACCFMSGHTGEYSIAELLGRGALHFFDKPFRMDEVVRVLGCLAEQHGARQASSA